MSRPTLRLTDRRGASLLEIMLVTGFVAFFALVLGGAMHTGTLVSRDTSVDVELSDLASRIAHEVQGRVMTATTSPLPAAVPQGAEWGPLADPPRYDLQQRWADGAALLEGAVLTPMRREPGWRTRITFVQDTGVYRGLFDERKHKVDVPAGRDLDGNGVIDVLGIGLPDGDQLDVFQLGRLEVQFFDAAGLPVPFEGLRFGGGRTFVLWNATNSPRLKPLFSKVENGGEESSLPAEATDAAVQLNLTVLHLPVPGADGRPEVRCLNISRAVSPR